MTPAEERDLAIAALARELVPVARVLQTFLAIRKYKS
jgi:hypothetical protein